MYLLIGNMDGEVYHIHGSVSGYFIYTCMLIWFAAEKASILTPILQTTQTTDMTLQQHDKGTQDSNNQDQDQIQCFPDHNSSQRPLLVVIIIHCFDLADAYPRGTCSIKFINENNDEKCSTTIFFPYVVLLPHINTLYCHPDGDTFQHTPLS